MVRVRIRFRVKVRVRFREGRDSFPHMHARQAHAYNAGLSGMRFNEGERDN